MMNITQVRQDEPRQADYAPRGGHAPGIKPSPTHPVVRVIGIGGAGCNWLNRLGRLAPTETRFLGIDTGSGTNDLGANTDVIRIGNGFGSGGDPVAAEEMFSDSAETGEYHSSVSRFVTGADLVIIVAGLGRGTGSGIAPLVARISKESGALTVVVVNMPFKFEGRYRSELAAPALVKLQNSSDSVLVIGNDNPLSSTATDGSMTLVGAFRGADEKISDSIRALIAGFGKSQNKLNEIHDSLRNSGKAVAITGISEGIHAARTAVEQALDGLEFGVTTISDLSQVKAALVHVEGGIGLSAGQIAEAVTTVRDMTCQSTTLHVSSVREITMGRQIRVTLILACYGSTLGKNPGSDLDRRLGLRENGRFTPDSGMNWLNELRRPTVVSMFETPRPIRRRGPMLLPVG